MSGVEDELGEGLADGDEQRLHLALHKRPVSEAEKSTTPCQRQRASTTLAQVGLQLERVLSSSRSRAVPTPGCGARASLRRMYAKKA